MSEKQKATPQDILCTISYRQTILIYGKKWADFCFRRYMPETGCTAKGTVFWNLGREKNFHAQSITAFTKAVLEAR